MTMKVRIVEVSRGDHKFWKIQTSLLGLVWWDETHPVLPCIYPTFDSLLEAEKYVERMYFEKEKVSKEYTV